MASKTRVNLSKEQLKIHELLENSWMGLGDTSHINVKNPFDKATRFELENPALHLLGLMRNPDYFYFTCKHIFNVELLPFQLVVLRELWTKPFPMIIASRGGSKSFLLGLYAMLRALLHQGCKVVVVGAAFRQAKVVFEYCEQIWHTAPILRDIAGDSRRVGPRRDIDRCTCRIGDSEITAIPLGDGSKIRGQRANYILCDEFSCLDSNTLVETSNGLMRIGDCANVDVKLYNRYGELEQPLHFIKTPKTDVYKITTVGNYSFKCSDKHMVETMEGWKLAKDLDEYDYLVFDNKYKFPTGSPLTKNEAWLFGALLSEGSINDLRQMQVHSTDISFMKRVVDSFKLLDSNASSLVNCKPAYIDSRGWDCKESYAYSISNRGLRTRFVELGLDYAIAINKKLPHSILQSDRETMISFLSALFEGDGSAFLWKCRECNNKLGVAYYSASRQLVDELQIVLKKLGYFSTIQTRVSNISENPQFLIRLNGKHAFNFAKELNIKKWQHTIDNCYEKDVIADDLRIVWDKNRKKWKVDITICACNKYIGRYKTYEEAVSAYTENKPIEHIRVKSVTKLDYQDNLYDFYLPNTHSFYGNGFVQHNSVPVSIYENVVRGFAAVSSNPVEKVKEAARVRILREQGMWTPKDDEERNRNAMRNQAILSGTAYYGFNHFADYWRRYKSIIESKGDVQVLQEIFKGEIPRKFDYRDYVIIRLPYELLPEDFMDEKQVASSKATQHLIHYQMEYGAVFPADSNGFYKRSLVENCVVGHQSKPIVIDGKTIEFTAATKGNPTLHYIMGVDPASEQDNFSIVVIELHENHRRIVYCWTTTRRLFKEKVKKAVIKEQDFYGYCCRKIRELMKVFYCERIIMDSQGGGVAIEEGLHDIDKMLPGERPIWQIVEEDKPKDSDVHIGLHILELVQFARADWVAESNHGMRKDFEDKVLLFPYFDPAIISEAIEDDKAQGRLYDTLEDAVMEIEELKDELASIVHTSTTNGRDRWDTPEVKLPGSKKGKLRKDRYSALLMANMAARQLQRKPEQIIYKAVGGFADRIKGGTSGQLYDGPAWLQEAIKACGDSYGMVVRPER